MTEFLDSFDVIVSNPAAGLVFDEYCLIEELLYTGPDRFLSNMSNPALGFLNDEYCSIVCDSSLFITDNPATGFEYNENWTLACNTSL